MKLETFISHSLTEIYFNSGLVNTFPNLFGDGSDLMISSDFQCDGTENSLDQCSSTGNWQINRYSSVQQAAISCEGI